MTSVIEVHDLRKAYGSVVAVDGISFEVPAGEIFGMVGPNGAGKTTTIECIEGLRQPDGGSVRLLGLDPRGQREAIAQRIGVQLQESALPPRLRAGEALALFGSFYERGPTPGSCSSRWGWPRSGLPRSASSPAAKSSACSSPWP